jgi:serine/threonine protein kinase
LHLHIDPSADDLGNSATALDDPRVAAAMQEYLDALEAGHKPSREVFLAQHAPFAKELAECLDGLAWVHEAAREMRRDEGVNSPLSAEELKLPLGDFRVIREIGRGGMGVVYEAVQLSLGRRVALKVLPLAAALDPKHLQRFKNEAQAAAQLHHTNIVPVYAVGSERGVHYYSMQLIEGYSLADLIDQRRHLTGRAIGAALLAAANQPTEKAIFGNPPIPSPPTGPIDLAEAFVPAPPIAAATTRARSSTIRTAGERNSNTYFRTIAGLIRQSALALEHAHQSGVIHRDIKPANLLLDELGNLWVTDFGLAQFRANLQLTQTGDMLGTLRYMSPEQASGDRMVLDHRSDIYSLGVTLYELLTLEPAIAGDEPHTVLRRILEQEPRPPRACDKHIPAELETIVLKSMAKAPRERYATAAALADDLERWLEDKPIKARRPTLVELASRWGRRHWAVATAAAGVLAVATLGFALATLLLSMAHTDTQAAYQREKTQTEMTERQRKAADESFHQARKAVDSFLQLSEEELAGKPALHETRRRFLATALAYYSDFLEKRKNDPLVREELARSAQWARRIENELTALERYAAYLLLANPLVRSDIGLTETQRKALEGTLPLAEGPSTGGWVKLANEEGISVAEQVNLMEWKVAEVLTAQQVKRLGQISLQRRGPFAFKSPDVVKALALTNEQRKQINLIIEEEVPARELHGGGFGPEEHGPPGPHGPGEGRGGPGPRGFGPGPPPQWDDADRGFDGKKGGGPRGKGKGGPPRGGYEDWDEFPSHGPHRGPDGGGKGPMRGERRGGPQHEFEGRPPPPGFEGGPPPNGKGPRGGKPQLPGDFGPAMKRTVERIVAILSDEQRAKWKELAGAEFQHELPWRPE